MPTHNHKMSIQEQADRWVMLLHSGADQAEILAQLSEWLLADPDHARAYQDAELLWQQLGQLSDYPGFSALRVSPKTIPKPSRLRFITRPAMTLAMAASIGFLVLGMPWLNLRLSADHMTAVGETKSLTLADGSVLHMNTQTAIAINFTANERRIRLLEGEAEFVVSKDPVRPFIVSVGDETIKALGTDFIVRCDHHQLTVTQLESRVEIQHPDQTLSVVLNPGEQLRHQHGQPFEAKTLVDTQKISAWRRGKLVFESTPLATVVAEINRYRSGEILLMGNKSANIPVSGVFDIQNLDKLIGAIEHTLAVKTLEIDEKLIVIY